MTTSFPTLIGKFIHHCGAIELLINNSIKHLSKDNILSSNAFKSPLAKRINLFRELLCERSQIDTHTTDRICKELNDLREKRNIVAHNPILNPERFDTSKEEIIAHRHLPKEVTVTHNIDRNSLEKLVEKSKEIMLEIIKLIPNSTRA